jgi:hypothetical protein
MGQRNRLVTGESWRTVSLEARLRNLSNACLQVFASISSLPMEGSNPVDEAGTACWTRSYLRMRLISLRS